MANSEVVNPAVIGEAIAQLKISDTKKPRGQVGGSRHDMRNILGYGPCLNCVHFKVNVNPRGRGKGSGVSIGCEQDIDPVDLFPGGWVNSDPQPNCEELLSK